MVKPDFARGEPILRNLLIIVYQGLLLKDSMAPAKQLQVHIGCMPAVWAGLGCTGL